MGTEYRRILKPPERSFFLFGVRGTGKSTWARQAFHRDAVFFDLLDERRHQEWLADPSLLALETAEVEPGGFVVIDEVQRVPAVLNEVHRLIETRKLRFALLGSSARRLRAAGVNLLAGRALRRAIYPFTPQELSGDFSLDRALEEGTLPLVVSAGSSADRRAVLESYVRLYIREEIQAEALVRNLPGFVRFLPIAALCHGQVVNISGLSRDCGVARTTVEGYLEILEDTLVARRLSAFESKLRVRERKHPKLYWVDPGIVRGAKRQLGPVAIEERGALFEGFVFHLLRAYDEAFSLFDEISYWQTNQGPQLEVDFLLRRNREYVAIEVKTQDRFQTSMTNGLRAIADLKGLKRRILVYRGDRVLRTEDGIEVWPFAKFDRVAGTGAL